MVKFDDKQVIQLMDPFPGNNISSTPWIGDLDNNGKLDIIYVRGTNNRQTYTFDGMRFGDSVQIFRCKKTTWGAYMGNEYNGVFQK